MLEFVEARHHIVDLEAGMYVHLRSAIEHHGLVDEEAFCEVMDLDRAMHRLSGTHPDAAAAVMLRTLLDFEDEEMAAVFGHRNWARLLEKGKAWIQTYLSEGGPDAPRKWEAAYRRAR